MTIYQIIILIIATIGVLFMLISAIGLLRLPDVYMRMHAGGKAATLGVICVLIAGGLYFGSGQLPRMLILITLFFVTAPIANTAIARAVYRVSTPDDKIILNYDEMAQNE